MRIKVNLSVCLAREARLLIWNLLFKTKNLSVSHKKFFFKLYAQCGIITESRARIVRKQCHVPVYFGFRKSCVCMCTLMVSKGCPTTTPAHPKIIKEKYLNDWIEFFITVSEYSCVINLKENYMTTALIFLLKMLG